MFDFLNTDNGRMVSLKAIRSAYPNKSLPRNPSDETLAALGYARVQRVPRPAGDVVTQGQLEQGENGKWQQTWTVREFTQDEKDVQLERAKEQKLDELDANRDTAFAAGMPYTLGGESGVVQTRPQDQINLMGLASKAQRQMAAGDDTVMPFRGLSNETRTLTPTETDAMAMAALAHIEGIYRRSWARKDAVVAAESLEGVAAIIW
jgi:hypothetical protein